MTITLPFLAPSLVKTAIEGLLPRGIGVARQFDAPVAWPRQHQTLGIAHDLMAAAMVKSGRSRVLVNSRGRNGHSY
jgi:hypothetical protein